MYELIFVITIGIVLIAFCYVIINQMLLINSINKRLIALAEDAISSTDSGISFGELPRIEPEEDSEVHSFDPHDIEV